MSAERQIERLKKEICDVWIVDLDGNVHHLSEKLWDDEVENIAVELYNLGYRKLTRDKLVEMAAIANDEWASTQHRCPHTKCPYQENAAIYCEMCHMVEVILRMCGEEEARNDR